MNLLKLGIKIERKEKNPLRRSEEGVEESKEKHQYETTGTE